MRRIAAAYLSSGPGDAASHLLRGEASQL